MVGNIPDQQHRLVVVSILYWQAREIPLVEECITSIVSQDCHGSIELKILLVDNGCGLSPRLPEGAPLEIVRLPINRGFAGGHNIGISQALARGADYVLLFNSDAVAEPMCVSELVAAAEHDRAAAFAGPLILRSQPENCVESAGQMFNTATGRHREIARGQSWSAVGTCARRVPAVSGCALLARLTAVDTIGFLDEGLFAYFEDMDWCLRARRAGYAVVMAPRARVRHLGRGSTSTTSSLTTYYSVRNHMVVAARYGGRVAQGLALGYQLAYLMRSPERRTKSNVAALARGARDAWAGSLGGRW